MKESKPEWYERMKTGPFAENVFPEQLQRQVEERTNTARPIQPRRRTSPWTAAGLIACLLVFAFVIFPTLNSQPSSSSRSYSPSPSKQGGRPAMMTLDYVKEHLKIDQSEDEVIQSFGHDTVDESVKRDFPISHQDNPDDVRTWSQVDLWRYDYGVDSSYKVQSALETDDDLDMQGLQNGEINSQLVIYWKQRKVERVVFAFRTPTAITAYQLGRNGTMIDSSPIAQNPEPTPKHAALAVRAVGESSYGKLELMPIAGTTETIQPLGAPSCIGQETDVSITGNYELFFTSKSNGTMNMVRQFDSFNIVQKENKIITMQKFDFPDVELFLLIPHYTDCHGLEFYAFGVDKKTGEAAAYAFEEGNNAIPNWTTSPLTAPKIVKDRLIVEGGRSAGVDGANLYTFKPDVSKHQLIMEKKVHIP